MRQEIIDLLNRFKKCFHSPQTKDAPTPAFNFPAQFGSIPGCRRNINSVIEFRKHLEASLGPQSCQTQQKVFFLETLRCMATFDFVFIFIFFYFFIVIIQNSFYHRWLKLRCLSEFERTEIMFVGKKFWKMTCRDANIVINMRSSSSWCFFSVCSLH